MPTRPAPSAWVAAGVDARAEVLPTEDGEIVIDNLDPQTGPRDARCVTVVFSDFLCPFCRDVALVLARLRKELPSKLRVVFKHLPTPQHFYARAAAVASQVVFLEAGTDAFWRFHDRAFANQHAIDNGVLAEWAREEGVAAESIVRRGADAERRLAQDVALAELLQIHGTPHLYINARSVRGAFPYDDIREWVAEVV